MGFRVFATQELHPFTAGGIGRVIGNFLADSSPEELARTAVVLWSNDTTVKGRMASVYPGLKCVVVSDRDYETETADGRMYPPANAYERTHLLHGRSVLMMQALLRLERELGVIDYIEFPDWGGMAFASCQEKKLGRGLRHATLAVRLHTTDGLLASFEQRGTDDASLALFDMERKAIADCDLIVGQLRPVAEFVRQFYGFDRAEWDAKVRIHAPVVQLDGKLAQGAVRPSLDTPITFTSKIQHCKRPDVFVRGCVEFLLKHPEVTAPVQFIAHAFDGDYYERVKALIPADLTDRFAFISGLSGVDRTAAIANTVCVFPTSYESFCLAAYEASLAGAFPVVNASTPAFSADTPWRHGVNCLGFDGSARDLCRGLEAAFLRGLAIEPVVLPADVPPWATASTLRADPQGAPHRPRVAAVIAHADDAGALISSLEALSAQVHALDEIVVVDGASEGPASVALLDRLESVPRIRVCRTGVASPTGSLLARGLDEVTADLVLLLESGTVIAREFVGEGVRALAGQVGFDFTTSHSGAWSSDSDTVQRTRLTVGEACAFALRDAAHAPPACVLARSDAARAVGFSDELGMDAWWNFHLRAIAAGRRYLVSSSIDIDAAPDRSGSGMPRQVRQHNVLRSLKAHLGDALVPPYALCSAAPHVPVLASENLQPLFDELEGYRRMELVVAATRLTQFLQYRAPWLLRAMTGTLRRSWRSYKKLRGRS